MQPEANVVPVSVHPQAVVSIDGLSPHPVNTCVDVSTPAGRAKVINALNGEQQSLWDLTAKGTFLFPASAWAATKIEQADEATGEVSLRWRIVFVTPDGTLYSTNSKAALEKMSRIMASEGPGPWNPPLRVAAVRQNTRNKRQCLGLLLDVSEPTETPAKKGK